MEQFIKSTRIYHENGVVNGYLYIKDGRFVDVVNTAGDQSKVVDFGDNRILPGIFETHNHGIKGYNLASINGQKTVDEATIKGYVKAMASTGVTSVFPTCHRDLIAIVANVAKEHPEGSEILGIHSEGPWQNRVGEKGVGVPYPEVSMEAAKKMVKDGGGLLKLVSLAPEIPGIDPIIKYFLAENIYLGFCHSNCTYDATMKAIAKGIHTGTHIGNVMTGIHHRDVGGLGACLLNDEMMCEVICDGKLICNEMLQLYFKVKSPSKFMMISDASCMCGAPQGKYHGWQPNTIMYVNEDGFTVSETGKIAAGSQTILYGMKNLVENLNMPLEEVCKMASLQPAQKYGFGNYKGSISPKKDADFIIIDADYNVIRTYVKGEIVYDCCNDGNLINQKFLDEMKIIE